MRVVLNARTTSPGHCLSLQQPLQEDGEELVRIHKTAVFGHRANAVGVAVGGESGMAAFIHHRLLQHGTCGSMGSGLMPGNSGLSSREFRDGRCRDAKNIPVSTTAP